MISLHSKLRVYLFSQITKGHYILAPPKRKEKKRKKEELRNELPISSIFPLPPSFCIFNRGHPVIYIWFPRRFSLINPPLPLHFSDHHCSPPPVGFHKQAASPIGFPCQTAPLRPPAFSTARFIKVWIANQISLIRWYFFLFLVEMKKFGRKKEGREKGGILIEATTFEAKSSSPSSSSLRFLEVCRFTFSGKKDQGIPLSGFDPWTLSSLLNFPGKVSPLFVVFF